MATGRRKTWQEKLLDSKDLPKTLVIPAPLEVNEVMRRLPGGKLVTINEIRQFLARKHRTTTACQLATGIFTWIAAYAAEEARAQDKKNVTPWWRTLKSGGELNPKYPGGAGNQKRLLETEGYRVVKKGRKWVVADFERSLVKL